MTRFVALLRSVNLGPNRLTMVDLKHAFAQDGLPGASTVVQTGNVLFDADAPAPDLEPRLEDLLHARFGYGTKVFVRSAAQVAALVEANPFPTMARNDPAHLVAMVLREPPSPEQLIDLRAAVRGAETFEAVGSTLYLRYPDGIGDSKLSSAVIERRLACSGTARNWNTVLKIAAGLVASPI